MQGSRASDRSRAFCFYSHIAILALAVVLYLITQQELESSLIRYCTAGESHGKALVSIVEGMPSGVRVTPEMIARDLARRQLGYGRGGRMKIEKDAGEILSGVRFGLTMGTPIAVLVRNRDWENWGEKMSAEPVESKPEPLTQPRPGHADLPGILKTAQEDIRNILERASARETAARVAAGAVAKGLLAELGISVVSHVTAIGDVSSANARRPMPADMEETDASSVRCLDSEASEKMVAAIDAAAKEGDTLGGVFEVIAYGCPLGLGGFASWEERLDARLAKAVIGIQAIKGVEFGDGFGLAALPGSRAHDEIYHSNERGYYHQTNRAGGLEGGLTNGEPLVVRAAMKPIPTLGKPLATVDMATGQPASAFKERADVCAVPAAAVVGEAVVAIELANAIVEKFGGDCLVDIKAAWDHYRERISR